MCSLANLFYSGCLFQDILALEKDNRARIGIGIGSLLLLNITAWNFMMLFLVTTWWNAGRAVTIIIPFWAMSISHTGHKREWKFDDGSYVFTAMIRLLKFVLLR